jgi:hypothetical protein
MSLSIDFERHFPFVAAFGMATLCAFSGALLAGHAPGVFDILSASPLWSWLPLAGAIGSAPWCLALGMPWAWYRPHVARNFGLGAVVGLGFMLLGVSVSGIDAARAVDLLRAPGRVVERDASGALMVTIPAAPQTLRLGGRVVQVVVDAGPVLVIDRGDARRLARALAMSGQARDQALAALLR